MYIMLSDLTHYMHLLEFTGGATYKGREWNKSVKILKNEQEKRVKLCENGNLC